MVLNGRELALLSFTQYLRRSLSSSTPMEDHCVQKYMRSDRPMTLMKRLAKLVNGFF